MNKIEFCYWLQGYFEIARNHSLNFAKLSIIQARLATITGDRNPFIDWLDEVCHYLVKTSKQTVSIEEFIPVIKKNLALLFHHVVDGSYAGISREERHRVHEEGLRD